LLLILVVLGGAAAYLFLFAGPREPVEPQIISKRIEIEPPAVEPKAEEKKPEAIKKEPLKPWVVHLASFRTESEATALRDRVKNAGYNVYTAEFVKNGIKWRRVRVGFYSTEADARAASKELARKFKIPDIWILKAPPEELR
jgi:cell division septation protein DedD